MFEAEVEMERRSSFLPLLLMMCLIAAILGLATYVVFQVRGRANLRAEQANGIVAAALEGPGPAVTHFRTGLVKSNGDEKPGDPNYRLLEKAGLVTVVRAPRGALVSLTPKGESLIGAIAGVQETKEADGAITYRVPLAQRQLVKIAGITASGVNNVAVEYTWRWTPNALGAVFDASGPLVKSFNLWDRQTLINKYEADFYRGEPTRSTLLLARNGREWKISAQ